MNGTHKHDSRKISATPDRSLMQSASVSSLTAPPSALPSENEGIPSPGGRSEVTRFLRKSTKHERVTKYVKAVQQYVLQVGHATNAEILSTLHASYPALSATTVHRITNRMVERGELQLAPTASDNSMRFDANLAPHDHFMCSQCGVLKDADISEAIRPLLETSIGDGCSISGRLVVSGLCKQCGAQKEAYK